MATLVTLWQLRKLASYSAFFAVCLLVERNDFYLQDCILRTRVLLLPVYWRTNEWAPDGSRPLAGVCVRCYKLPATATNKRCQKCQIATLTGSDSVNEASL
jgi:hypothetical protein